MGRVVNNLLIQAIKTRPAAAIAATPEVKLFTVGPIPILPTADVTDFTECTFDGYAAVSAVYGAPVNLPSTQGLGVIGPASFVCTGPTTPETVLGYYITDGATMFVAGEYFDVPIPINNNGDFIDLQTFLNTAFVVPV